jgi:hypothetical protein
MRFFLFFLFGFILFEFTSCGQISEPLRNKIEFEDHINSVADSLFDMETLLKKLPTGDVLSTFTDKSGILFVNGRKLGPLNGAIDDLTIRQDSVFKQFTNEDYIQFVTLSIYLLKNHIGYSMRDNVSGFFVHGYRETDENSYNDMREVMINVDTTSDRFVKRYQILDRSENITLVAPIDANVKR